MAKRFKLTQDFDCHWFVIPADRQLDWDKWNDRAQHEAMTPDPAPGAFDVPEWATPVDGPHAISFEDPFHE